MRDTHFLERTEGGTCQDTERNQLSEAHSLPGDGRWKDLSEQGKKPTKGGPLTPWRRQREGIVRSRKETDQARHTHKLKTAEGGTCQDMERNRSSKAHSRSGDSRGRDLSGHGKKPTKQGTLTNWRQQREEPVKTQKETDQVRHTNQLETARDRLVRTRKETD